MLQLDDFIKLLGVQSNSCSSLQQLPAEDPADRDLAAIVKSNQHVIRDLLPGSDFLPPGLYSPSQNLISSPIAWPFCDPMKVLLVTATFPTPDRPSAGIFVRHQFRFFRSHATDHETFDLFKIRTHTRGERHSLPRRIWSALKFIPHYFKRYDIVHVHSLSSLMHAARLYKFLHPRTRIILSIHGSSVRQFDQHSKYTRRRFAKAAKKSSTK